MVHEITFGFGGLSGKKMSVLVNFPMQNTNLVSVLSKNLLKFLWSDRTEEFHKLLIVIHQENSVSNLIKINCYNMLFFP